MFILQWHRSDFGLKSYVKFRTLRLKSILYHSLVQMKRELIGKEGSEFSPKEESRFHNCAGRYIYFSGLSISVGRAKNGKVESSRVCLTWHSC